MGSNTSKPTAEAAVTTLKTELDVCDNSDPRSPTPEITRTPLQVRTNNSTFSNSLDALRNSLLFFVVVHMQMSLALATLSFCTYTIFSFPLSE